MDSSQDIPPGPEHPAYAVLRAFFDAMRGWEEEMLRESKDLPRIFEGMSEEQVSSGLTERGIAARKRLAMIFERYCEAGERAKRLADVLHFGAEQPIYDPNKEEMLSVHELNGRVIIETKTIRDFPLRMRYEMIEHADGWKIRDNRKCFSERLGKWQRMDL